MAEAEKATTQRMLVPLDGSPLAELILLQVIPPIEEVITRRVGPA